MVKRKKAIKANKPNNPPGKLPLTVHKTNL
jgi:hypothetical protein